MRLQPTVAGISDHNGWAIVVSVAVRDGAPVLLDRRRVELIDPGLPNQPYHHETLGLDSMRAEALVKEVQESAAHCAERALAKLKSGLEPVGEVIAIALRVPPLPHLPESVAAAHASTPVLVRADAMIYHDALCKAASSLGIGVEMMARGEERPRASDVLRTEVERLNNWLVDLRASLGPPWQKDHQDAMARAIAALGKHMPLKLPPTRLSRRQ